MAIPIVWTDLYSIKRTQIEMVRDRGYEVGDEAQILNYDETQFVNYYSNRFAEEARLADKKNPVNPRDVLGMIYTHNVDGSQLYVYYATTKSTRELEKEVTVRFVERVQTGGYARSIIISPVPLMAKSQEELSKLRHIPVQVFEDKDLVSNVTHHKYNPKFELVPADKEMELLASLSLRRKDQLGLHGINDPIIKYYDWPVNAIVKIKRNNLVQETITPQSLYYRLIVSD